MTEKIKYTERKRITSNGFRIAKSPLFSSDSKNVEKGEKDFKRKDFERIVRKITYITTNALAMETSRNALSQDW